MRLRYAFSLLIPFIASSVSAAPPDVMTLVRQMKAVFEPARPSTREVEIAVSGPKGEHVVWAAHQARTQQADGKRTLLVMQEPGYTRGNALLIYERQGRQPDVMWWYPPALRRVRELVPVETYQRFFDTDLTYADLGYIERQGAYRLLGEEEDKGKPAYKIEFVLDEKVFYSRILTWVDAETMLPRQRNYYDVAGRLWKVMTVDQVKGIDGIPTPLHIRMRDVQQNSITDVTFSHVRYDVDLPAELFD